ncbi:gamma-tubulin complex component GCP6 [Purpureocillium lavendulum]|uniref:Gamma-tubulin complex component GCP6 n=1 Tax=Purpureocillium lavendulum TaxID=1247861 RepID=A0AB34G033_9HYPO|nr:gamma-tubulin complex component GCP6 [Purpureocillium lavendulum]
MVPRPPRPEAFLTPRPTSAATFSSRLGDVLPSLPFLTTTTTTTTDDDDGAPAAALALTAAIFAFVLVLLLFLSLRRPRRLALTPWSFLPWATTRNNNDSLDCNCCDDGGTNNLARGGGGVRNPNRLSRHEMTSRRQSLYDFTGSSISGGCGGGGGSPRSSMYIPYLILGIADNARQPLLERYRDEPDADADAAECHGPPLELDEATWERSDGKDGRPDVLHWHGANMLNTAWGWMA